jgi:hypothetical protein
MMHLNEYSDKVLQNKIDTLPEPDTILFNEIKDRGNGAYAIGKPKNNKDRNNTWQTNHRLIIEYIERSLEGLRRLPTVKEIAKELKISRVTVTTHLKDYKNNPAHELERGMMNLMAEKILLEVLRQANDFGATIRDLKDVLACFKMMNPTTSPEIVINNIKIDIGVFNNLSANKKTQIIEILTKDSNV